MRSVPNLLSDWAVSVSYSVFCVVQKNPKQSSEFADFSSHQPQYILDNNNNAILLPQSREAILQHQQQNSMLTERFGGIRQQIQSEQNTQFSPYQVDHTIAHGVHDQQQQQNQQFYDAAAGGGNYFIPEHEIQSHHYPAQQAVNLINSHSNFLVDRQIFRDQYGYWKSCYGLDRKKDIKKNFRSQKMLTKNLQIVNFCQQNRKNASEKIT